MDPLSLNRIKFRAWRRGFREADLILGAFADRYLSSMTDEDVHRFEALLEQSDHDIYAWIVGSKPVPAPFDNDLMARLQAFSPADTDASRHP